MLYKAITTLQTKTNFVKATELFLLDCLRKADRCLRMKVNMGGRGRSLFEQIHRASATVREILLGVLCPLYRLQLRLNKR